MPSRRRLIKILLALAAFAVAVVVGPPTAFLAWVWWREPTHTLPPPSAGFNDHSRLNATTPGEVIPVVSDPAEAERQLATLVRRAAAEGRQITISGASHSMGGHTLLPGALVLDLRPFHSMTLDVPGRVLTVGAGARWSQVIPFLDAAGLAVGVMQSNNDFTVGGSISVNCHGWQNDSPPVAGTVESFRLVTAAGEIVRCSRAENRELFSLALGGYRLFGVILDVRLRVVPNEYYRAEQRRVQPANYDRVYHELTRGRDEVGLAYGRISVAPSAFLTDAIAVVLRRQPEATANAVTHTFTHDPPGALKRLVFRAEVGSDYGKNLRWRLENLFGETGGRLLSRNEIMDEPSDWFANRDSAGTDILHEYFVPVARLGEFIAAIRPVLLRHRPDLLNITLRNVAPDPDTLLRYAREEVFGVVMLFHQCRDAASETAMQALTRELIDAALAGGGTYYLPYRPHATRAQFARAYPMAAEFFALKRRHDPAEIFQNEFYRNYGAPPPTVPK